MIDETYDDERDKLLKSGSPSEDRFRAIREAFQMDMEAAQDLYAMAVDDFRFVWVPGNQWDGHMSQLRGNRPKYEYNILRQSIKQVINDNRQNTPTIKVRPSRDGTTEIAEIRQGLIRNIESVSNADQAYDWGGMYAITSGFGCWEVATEYTDDDTFEQDIIIKRIENPYAVFFDCAARSLDRSDARRAWVIEAMPRSEFKAKYPKAELVDFDSIAARGASYNGWFDRDTVRVAAYWHKKRKTRRIYRLNDGRVVDANGFDQIAEQAANPPAGPDGQPMAAPVTIDRERTVEYDCVVKEIISGKETLEGPFEWAGKYIPIIPCWGDIVSDEGKDYWYGMARPARDAQVVFNFSQSNIVEVIASQPKAPWMYTPKMVEGFERQWENAAIENAAGLPYNPDPEAPGGRPTREAPPQFPNAWFDLARINQDNLKATTGIHDASLGKQSNETSGRAILARQHEGDVATFDYSDNIVRAIQFTGVVVNDLIDKIYDADRDVRILGDDQKERYVRVNQPVWDGTKYVKQNDMTAGKYDIVVTTGPSFTTQRMETLNAMSELARAPGPTGALGAYGVLKYMDVPGMGEFADVMRKTLVAQGMPFKPEEGEAPIEPPAPPPPNPLEVAEAKLKEAQAARAAAEAEQTSVETQRMIAMDQFALGPTVIPTDVPNMSPVPIEPAPMQQPQPPDGGFFMPDDTGFPPTAPDGFPG